MSIGTDLKAARERLGQSVGEVAAAIRSKSQIIEGIERDDYSVFAAPIYAKGFIKLYAQYVGLDPLPLLEAYAAASAPRRGPAPASTRASGVPAAAAPVTAPAAGGGPVDLSVDPAAPAVAEQPVPERARTDRAAELDLFNDVEGRGHTPAPTPRPAVVTPEPPAPEPTFAGRVQDARALAREVCLTLSLAARERWQQTRASLAMGRDPWKVVPIAIGAIVLLIFLVSALSRSCAHAPSGEAAKPRPAARGGAEPVRLAAEAPEPYFD